MSRRLVTVEEVDGWKQLVSAAVERAQRAIRPSVQAQLDAHGLSWSSPSNRAAGLWSMPEWRRVVDAEVRPVAEALAGIIFDRFRERVNVRGSWGGTADQAKLARLLVDRVYDAGHKISDALQAHPVTGASNPPVVHPDAQSTVAMAYQSAFKELDRLASNVASHMSNAAQTVLAETAARYEPLIQNVWCCSFVPASRETHMEADGQRQNAGDPFDVGDEQLMFPGDPDGSDEETANCLCWLEIEELEVADLPPAESDAESSDVVA